MQQIGAGTRGARAPARRAGRSRPPRAGWQEPPLRGGLQEPPAEAGLQEPPGSGGVSEPPARGAPAASAAAAPPAQRRDAAAAGRRRAHAPAPDRLLDQPGASAPLALARLLRAAELRPARDLQDAADVSFFPLLILILAVLGLDRVRPGDAHRGGGGRRVRRLPARGGLPAAQPSAWSRNRSSSPPRPRRWCAGCSSARRSSRPRSRCSAARSWSSTGCCR